MPKKKARTKTLHCTCTSGKVKKRKAIKKKKNKKSRKKKKKDNFDYGNAFTNLENKRKKVTLGSKPKRMSIDSYLANQ